LLLPFACGLSCQFPLKNRQYPLPRLLSQLPEALRPRPLYRLGDQTLLCQCRKPPQYPRLRSPVAGQRPLSLHPRPAHLHPQTDLLVHLPRGWLGQLSIPGRRLSPSNLKMLLIIILHLKDLIKAIRRWALLNPMEVMRQSLLHRGSRPLIPWMTTVQSLLLSQHSLLRSQSRFQTRLFHLATHPSYGIGGSHCVCSF